MSSKNFVLCLKINLHHLWVWSKEEKEKEMKREPESNYCFLGCFSLNTFTNRVDAIKSQSIHSFGKCLVNHICTRAQSRHCSSNHSSYPLNWRLCYRKFCPKKNKIGIAIKRSQNPPRSWNPCLLGPGPYKDERKLGTFQLIILCILREDTLGLITSSLCHSDFLVIIDWILERRDKIFFFSFKLLFSYCF